MMQAELFDSARETQYSKAELLQMLSVAESVEPTTKIRVPSDIVPALAKYVECEQEHFVVVILNGGHDVIDTVVVSVGLVNRALVHPREVFRPAIAANGVAIIVAHNHPSGNTAPSPEDFQITKKLVDAGELLGIRVLDHVVVGKLGGFYSFLEQGDM